MRIYPTVIMRHTYLGQLYESGKYDTLSLEETIDLCSELLAFFEQEQIRVIRLGLHSSPGIERDRLAGPWHPALRELCESRRYRNAILQDLEHSFVIGKRLNFLSIQRIIPNSRAKKSNLQFFTSMGYHIEIKTKETIQRNQFLLAYADKEQKGVEVCG